MKKSKLVQNSRDLLSRSFNPAKCKTSLRLAGSRVKLLRNKKEVQVKQMKREIAQLLESGQDQTARIRVEHVIREEKMMAAYDLLEIYCELVIARLPIIESQKNCPIDLKEAIASLVFAAPRCGDIPELLDVRKQITAKYGKDFTTAAVELRPQCGVDRMLVEKLSATAPNLETKTKILTTIAEEHNVKWEPKSFGEKDPGSLDDQVSGSFEKLNEQYPKPPPEAQVRPSNNMMPHIAPSNFGQQNDKTSEKLLFAQTFGSTTTPYQSEARPPVAVDERSREDSNMNPPDRHRWFMEFKDATSAAQAAAESAERASMAARAAAELSSHNRIPRQYSTETHDLDVDTLKYGPPKSKSSNAPHDGFSTEHGTRLQKVKQADGGKPNNLKATASFKEDGAGSSQGHIQSFSSDPKESIGEYSQKNSLNEVPNDEMRVEKQSFSYEAETGNSSLEEAENVEEKRTLRRHSIKSFHSQSSISDDNVNIFSNSEYQKFEKDARKSLLVGGEAPQTSTHESAALFFDKYDSETDDGGFDVGPTYDEREELGIHLPLFGGKSPERAPAVADSWSPPADSSSKIVTSSSPFFFTDKKSSDFSESTKLRNDSELDSAHVTFDESDGPFSDSDDDTKNPRRHTGYDNIGVHKPNEIRNSVKSSFKLEDSSLFSGKDLQHSSDDELSPSLKVRWNNSNWDHISDEDSPRKLSFIKPDASQPALGPKESQTESKEIDTESNSESEQRLNFGKLTGGFRHKGHRNQLPFIKSRLNMPSDKESETISHRFEEPDAGTTSDHKEISTMQNFNSASDTDTSEEEVSRRSYCGKLEAKVVKTKPNLFISSDNRDVGDYSPKDHVRSAFSRRTKVSPSIPNTNSYTEEQLDSDARIAKKPTTSSNSETPKKFESTLKNSSKWETYEHPKAMPAKSNFWGPPPLEKASSVTKQELEAQDNDSSPGRKYENSNSPESQKAYEPQKKSSLFGNSGQTTSVKLTSKPSTSSSTSMQESKVSPKSSVVEDPPGYKLKAQAPVDSKNTSSNKEESPKKASHVHPKLPDYDTLFQSLRMKRS